MTRRYRAQKAYRCWDCDKVYLDKKFAQECCEPRACKRCGCDLGVRSAWTACADCREILLVHRAKVVDASHAEDGVVGSDTHQGNWDDGYSSSIGEMLELHEDEGTEPPCFVHPCKVELFEFDPQDVIDRLTDNHHEDAFEDIVDSEGLFAFFDEWNAKQVGRSYWMDRKKIIVIDQKRLDALLAQPEETP